MVNLIWPIRKTNAYSQYQPGRYCIGKLRKNSQSHTGHPQEDGCHILDQPGILSSRGCLTSWRTPQFGLELYQALPQRWIGSQTFQYIGFESLLSGHRTTLEDYFKKNPPRTAKEAAWKVEELTGEDLSVDEVRRFMHQMGMKPLKTGHIPGKADPEKQKQFLDERLMPLIQMVQAGHCHLFFVDAAHFVLAPFVGVLWSFARMFIKAASGRNRINVLGAMHFVTRKMETIVNTTYINAETIVELMKKLAKTYKDKPLYLVLDNARYQHCDYVKEQALLLHIQLVFVPPYSPNLNLIERVWRYIKKEVLRTRYFDCALKFHQAIQQALIDINHDSKTRHDIKSLITPNFQTFSQNLYQ